MPKVTFQSCISWYSANRANIDNNQFISTSRDIFQARLDKFVLDLVNSKKIEEQSAYLLSAIVGEIGNNSFDHNLGQWRDSPGCWFEYNLAASFVDVCIADRGQGIKSSLLNVDSSIQTDNQALNIAFSKRISGRSPEKRGNGLKFVKEIINNNAGRVIFCSSGNGKIYFGGLKNKIEKIFSDESSIAGSGVFTYIRWEMQ